MKHLIVALTLIAFTAPAFATSGAVNKRGCHSKPRHCHSISSTNKFKNGRRYVPYGAG